MPVSDDQLELLECYIDGELPAGEEDALRRRLESEPTLASALDALRQDRDVRSVVWKSFEPDVATVQRLVSRVEQAVDRHNAWAYRIARYRIPFAAAACILIGFLVGWVGRGGPTPVPGGGETIAVVPPPAHAPPFATPGTGVTTVSNPLAGPFELPIVDEYGRVVAVQRFKSADDLNKFIEDLNTWQRKQEQIKSQNIVPAGAEKF